jgi:amino acid permease
VVSSRCCCYSDVITHQPCCLFVGHRYRQRRQRQRRQHSKQSQFANMAAHASGDQNASDAGRWNDNENGEKNFADVDLRGVSSPETPAVTETLARKLSSRQVSMIAIGGTIGTGLFLGTGKSLATGGPASMLISYAIVGAIVFMTMLALGEMAAFVPVAGSFCTFAG